MTLPRRGSAAAHALGASVLAGVLTYVILALVSRTVDAHQFDQFSVFWSLALVIGFGVFLPLEQESARQGANGFARDDTLGAMMRTGAILTVAGLLVSAAAAPLFMSVLDLSAGLAVCCALVVLASAVQFTARGALLREQRVTAFSNTLILDTVLRVAALGAIAVAVVTAIIDPRAASTWYAIALVAAIVLAHGWAVPWRTWGGSPAVRRAYVRGVAFLIAVGLLSQVLVNAGAIVIQAFDPATGAAGNFQASSTLARVPLAIITPVQAMLVAPLAAVALAHDRAALARLTGRIAVAGAVLAILGGLGAWWIGPWVVELIFGAGRALPALDIALLVVGVIVHVVLIVFTQALVATGDHREALVTWALALGAAIVVFVVMLPVGGAVSAVELGFGVGSLAGAVTALVLLFRLAKRADHRTPEGIDD